MKTIIKGLLVPLVISILFGFLCGKIVYSVYKDDIASSLTSSKLYVLQKGVYDTYDSMREDNGGNNYVYYMDDEGYKTVVGITSNENNIDKIKGLYDEDVKVLEYYIANELFNDKQNEYDVMLNNTDNIYEVKEVVDNILNLYREDNTIKLVLAN